MARKLKLYYVTQQPTTEGNPIKEGFFVGEKKRQAEKAAKREWYMHGSIAVTRVRLKEKGWLKHIMHFSGV